MAQVIALIESKQFVNSSAQALKDLLAAMSQAAVHSDVCLQST